MIGILMVPGRADVAGMTRPPRLRPCRMHPHAQAPADVVDEYAAGDLVASFNYWTLLDDVKVNPRSSP
jgi:hypothetical protein